MIMIILLEHVGSCCYIIVRSDGQHVDGPAGGRPHCAGNPGVSYVLNKFPKSRGGGAVSETLEHGWDISFWKKGQGHQLSDVLVCGAVCAVSWLQS